MSDDIWATNHLIKNNARFMKRFGKRNRIRTHYVEPTGAGVRWLSQHILSTSTPENEIQLPNDESESD